MRIAPVPYRDGITQWRVKDGQVEQEWQLFNELDLIMQIARARRDVA